MQWSTAELAEVMGGMVDAADDLPGRHGGLPAVSSRGAAEMDGQDDAFSGRSPWVAPIRDTHALGGAALLAASDALRAYAALVAAEAHPVFAHLVLARAVTEAAVDGAWLDQPGVTLEERARRGLVERYHAALQHRRVPELRPAADRLQDELKRIASSLRWTLITGEHDEDLCIGGTRRPHPVGEARALLATGPDPAVGAVLWEHLCPAMHGSWHLDPAPGEGSAVAPGEQVRALALLRLYREAAQRRADLMGWTSGPWEAARRRADEITAGSPPPGG